MMKGSQRKGVLLAGLLSVLMHRDVIRGMEGSNCPPNQTIPNIKSLRRVTIQKYPYGPISCLFFFWKILIVLLTFFTESLHNGHTMQVQPPSAHKTLHFFWPTAKFSSNVLYNTSIIVWPNIPNGEFRRGFRLPKWRGGRRRDKLVEI